MELHALGVDRHVDAARLPEPRILRDKPVVRRVDEYLDGDARTARVQSIRDDLARLHVAIEHCRADVERPDVGGVKYVLASRQTGGHDRRHLQTGESMFGDGRVAYVDADIRTRDQR